MNTSTNMKPERASKILSDLRAMKKAQTALLELSTKDKNSILENLAQALIENQLLILSSNKKDLESYQKSQRFQKAFEDRLLLTEARIQGMAQSLREVARLPDPVGQVVETKILYQGLVVRKTRSPLGVLFLIFEARPNVIFEAFSLALKSGNALILKGGRESDQTCAVCYKLIEDVLMAHKIPSGVFMGLVGASRDETTFLMKQNRWIDVLIPRGGDALIEFVTENSRIPIIKNDRGMCHLYVHKKASLEMALSVLENAKTQRPSVCNAIETLLIDREVAPRFLSEASKIFKRHNVQLITTPEGQSLISPDVQLQRVTESSFDTEYLDLKLNIQIVSDLDEALDHIALHGSKHSEAIITENEGVARTFQNRVDAAVVYWNASTRFTDGGQLGLGAEIGISTQKLHVRGPVGLESLTSLRWVVDGTGQIRQS